VLLGIIVVALNVASASADGGDLGAAPHAATSTVVVLEARVGSSNSARDEISTAIARGFEEEGYPATPAAIARTLGPRMPRPGVDNRRLTTAEVLKPLSAGFLAWTQGRFEEAEALLLSGLDQYERNIALVVTDNSNQDIVFRAMAALALSQWAVGDRTHDRATLEAARKSMLNLHRAFPTRRFSSEEFAPDAIEFHRKIGKEASALGTGSVSIRIDSPNVMVFVDGQMRGTGRADLAGMVPGQHAIYLQEPGRGYTGRRFEINVSANQDSIVNVAWDAHAAFWATAEFTGLTYATDAERKEKLAVHAAEVASWGPSGVVAVVERVEAEGRPSLRGTLYGSNRDQYGSQTVELSASEPDVSARELARRLMKSSPTPPQQEEARDAPASSAERPSYSLPAFAVGAGLAAIVGGAAVQMRKEPPDSGPQPKHLISSPGLSLQIGGGLVTSAGLYFLLRGHEDARAPSGLSKGLVFAGALVMAGSTTFHVAAPLDENHDYRFRPLTTAGFVVGSGTLGLGLYRWLRETRGTSRPSAAALGTGVALSASAAFLLAVDEDDDPKHAIQRHYWDTSLYGLISGGAGVVLLGLGWWGSSHASTSSPVATFTGDRTMLGWAGTF